MHSQHRTGGKNDGTGPGDNNDDTGDNATVANDSTGGGSDDTTDASNSAGGGNFEVKMFFCCVDESLVDFELPTSTLSDKV